MGSGEGGPGFALPVQLLLPLFSCLCLTPQFARLYPPDSLLILLGGERAAGGGLSCPLGQPTTADLRILLPQSPLSSQFTFLPNIATAHRLVHPLCVSQLRLNLEALS